MISSFAIQRQLGIGHEWSQDVQSGAQTTLRYSYRFICNDNYYGDTCSKICNPRDDHFGHFTCKPDGQIACLPGWKGEYCQERKQEKRHHMDTQYCLWLKVKRAILGECEHTHLKYEFHGRCCNAVHLNIIIANSRYFNRTDFCLRNSLLYYNFN